MGAAQGLYRWLTDWLQQERQTGPIRLSDFERVRQMLEPGDVILIDGQSRLDDTLKSITLSRWSRAALYLGRLHDIADPAMRATLAAYLPCSPDTQLVVQARLDRGLVLEPLSVLEPDHLRICRPRGLPAGEQREVTRYAVSRLGIGSERAWWSLLALLMPWSWLPRRWRTGLFARTASGLLRLLSGTTLGEAYSFVQFPVLPLVKRADQDQPRLYRRQPRVFFAADFDHSPYFDVIKYPFIDQVTHEKLRLQPWQGQEDGDLEQRDSSRAEVVSLADIPRRK